MLIHKALLKTTIISVERDPTKVVMKEYIQIEKQLQFNENRCKILIKEISSWTFSCCKL